MERAQLYQRVDKRAEEMFTQGLREEVQGLLAQGVSPSATSMQGIGYKETIDWIEGRCSKEEAIAQIQQATRKYAKRQWTWFRKDREMQWFDVQAYANADELSDALYQYYMGENDGSWQR